MKLYKVINPLEAKLDDLAIVEYGGLTIFLREYHYLEYKPEDVAFKPGFIKKAKKDAKFENDEWGDIKKPKLTVIEKPKKINFHHIKKIKKMKEEGKTSAQIAEKLNLPLEGVNKHYAE